MKFTLLSFSFGKDKAESATQKGISHQPSVERFNNSFFYPVDFNDRYSLAVLKDMYEEVPEVNAPINYIIDKMANIPYNHVKETNGETTEIVNSKPIDVLDNPNQYANRDDFTKSFFLNALVYGVGYVNTVKSFGMGGIPGQLYVLPSAGTKPVVDEVSKKDPRLNEIKGYIVDWGNGEVKLDKEEVFVQYEANLELKVDAVRSRLMAAIMTSESLRYNYEERIKIYKDRGAVGIISPTGDVAVDAEEAKTLRRNFNEETGITGEKMPIRVSTAPMTYTQIGFDIKQLELNPNKMQDFRTVCSILSIDPAIFGLGNDTYNNKILAKVNFWEDVGQPRFNSYLQLLGRVFDLPKNEYFKADYSEIPALQGDLEKKTNANSKAYNDGAIWHSEYREAIGQQGGEDKYKWEIDKEASTGTQGQD